MSQLKIRSVLACVLSASALVFTTSFSPVYSYTYLSEFVSSDGTSLHQSGSTQKDSDQIMAPSHASNPTFVLCTGGTGYSNAHVSSDTDKTSELLADLNTAASTWENAGSGTSLSISATSTSSGCPNLGDAFGGNDGTNYIFFNDKFEDGTSLPAGLLAYTITTLKVQNGKLHIVDADILFNTAETFLTSSYINANGPANSTSKFSFLGVLTHEMGHALGLAHSPITDDNSSDGLDTHATMYQAVGSLFQSEAIESLTRDDMDGMMNLYPASNSFSSDSYAGSISGHVYRADGSPQRGAHVTAFAVSAAYDLAGKFSGMDGTKASPDGAYTIRGLPLNTDFILFVEPAHRPGVESNFIYSAYNTPITEALSSEDEGYKTFAVEAYPDVQVSDVRTTGDDTSSPGIDDAKKFNLTSSDPSASNVNFYLSQSFDAPNDAYSGNTTLTLNPSTDASVDPVTVNNGNPLVLKIEIQTDLSVFPNPSISLTALKSGQNYDWSNAVPSGSLKTNSATYTMNVPSPAPENGTYAVTATLSDSKYGDFSVQRNIKISNWTASPNAGLVYADGTNANGVSGSSSGGGGCQLQKSNTKSTGMSPFLSAFLFTILAYFYWRRRRISN